MTGRPTQGRKRQSAADSLNSYASRNHWECCACHQHNRIGESECRRCFKPRYWQLGFAPPGLLPPERTEASHAAPRKQDAPAFSRERAAEGALDIATVAEYIGCERAQVVSILSGLFAREGQAT